MRPTRSVLAALATVGLLTAAGSLTAASGSTLQTVAGTVRVLVVDDADAGSGGSVLATRAVADVGGRLLDVPPAQAKALGAGDRVVVTAAPGASAAASVTEVPGATEVPGDTVAGPVSAAAVARSVTGAHTLTVLPVYWSAPDDAAPLSVLTTLAAGTAEFWSAQSGGRIAVTPSVRSWVRIDDPGSCSSSALANAALAAHGVALPSSVTDHIMIYFPRRADCGGWAGLGQVGGPLIWVNGYPLLDVVAHEFGHNLGLGHANTATCTSGSSRVTLSSSCSVAEYRDYADVMGIAMDAPTGSLNTALADSLGLAQTVTAAAGTRATVDLAPLARTDAVRALRIRVASGWVYLDYRPGTGRDQRMPAWAGVQAHLLPDGGIPASRLLDGQPQSGYAFSAVSLPAGTTWSVPGSGLSVTVASVTSSGARIEVTPDGVVRPTAAPVITSPAPAAVVGSSTTVSWRVSSKVASVRLLVDGRQVSSTTTSSLSGTIRVGLAHGQHALALQAVDAAGQASATSSPVTVTADVEPPGTPGWLALSSTQVLSWRPSTDAVSGLAGYLVSMDGGAPLRIGTVTSVLTRTPVGRHTWWVAAVDRVGNVSPASGLIVVRATAKAGAKSTAVRVVAAPGTAGQRLLTGRTVGATRPL